MNERKPAKAWMTAILVGGTCAAILAFLSVRGEWFRDPLAAGLEAYRRGEWVEAQASARKRLENLRSDPSAIRLLARSSSRLGKDDTAEALYRRLGADKMEAEDLFLLGRGLLRSGRTGPALASLRAAREADPDHAETLEILAREYASAGQTTEAAEAAERLARQTGWEVRGRVLLAPLKHKLRDSMTTAQLLDEAFKIDPRLKGASMSRTEAAKLLAISLLECGRPAEASRALEQVDHKDNEQETDWLMSRVFLQEGRADDAKAALARIDAKAATDPMRKEPSKFVGARKCAPCHDDKYDAQQSSRHSMTFTTTADLKNLPWPEQPIVDPANPEVRHTFRRAGAGDSIEMATKVASNEFRAVIEYALGSNHQGQSFLAREPDGRVRELRISRYPVPPVWDRTNQHPEIPPDEPGYLGRPLSGSAATGCLECHFTTSQGALNPAGRAEGADRGIGCERCHGPGGNHLMAMDANKAGQFPDLAIARPRLATSEQIMGLCGECHKAPLGQSPTDPGFIRFQAPTLAMSRCYTESNGGLSCITCHDPHRDVEKSGSHYEEICLNCHGTPVNPSPDKAPKNPRIPCPVDPSKNCLGCHMPRVNDSVPRAIFTDHHIRIREKIEGTDGAVQR